MSLEGQLYSVRRMYTGLRWFSEDSLPEDLLLRGSHDRWFKILVDANNGFGKSERFPNSPVYYDGSFGLVLAMSAVLPVSVLSFEISYLDQSLDIVQLQRLAGAKRSLEGVIGWRRRMIETVERFARAQSIARVRIQPAKENVWVKSGEFDETYAKMFYDTPAKRLKYAFKQGDPSWWVKEV